MSKLQIGFVLRRALGMGVLLLVLILLAPACGRLVVRSEGDQLAFAANRIGNTEIYLLDTARGLVANLTGHAAYDVMPAWSPDGRRLIFASDRGGDFDLYLLDFADGSTRVLVDTEDDEINPAWSPDGRWLAFMSNREGQPQIYLMALDENANAAEGAVSRITDLRASADAPTWSPDSTHIAYQTRGERLFWEIYIVDVAANTRKRLVDLVDTDTLLPKWSADGTQVVFQGRKLSGDTDLFVVSTETRLYRQLTSNPGRDERWPVWGLDTESATITFVAVDFRGQEGIAQMSSVGGSAGHFFAYGDDMLALAWRPR